MAVMAHSAGAPRTVPTPDGPPAVRRIRVPELALVLLVGPSGSGKSTFAARHGAPGEVVSSDACRALVADDENDQSATRAAFEVLHAVVAGRLEHGRFTVVDATNLEPAARKPLLDLSRRFDVPAVAIAFDLGRSVGEARNLGHRNLDKHVLHRQHERLRHAVETMGREGFRAVEVLRSVPEVDAVVLERVPAPSDRRSLAGPFDIVGDVHGCDVELRALLDRLGYPIDADGAIGAHPHGRTAVFVGDLVDRGPGVAEVLRLVLPAVRDGRALLVPGNHEDKLVRALQGRNVTIAHGLAESLDQLAGEPELGAELCEVYERLPSHLVLDGGRLVVAHGGIPERMHNRDSSAVRAFVLYGGPTGEIDELGRPIRSAWVDAYRGDALVVYGHTPVEQAEVRGNTVDVDTGCVFGGALTALRYPERELVSVPATGVHWERAGGATEGAA